MTSPKPRNPTGTRAGTNHRRHAAATPQPRHRSHRGGARRHTLARSTISVLAASLITVAFSGCSGGGSPVAAAPTPTPSAQTYTSKAFSIPLTVPVTTSLKTEASTDTDTFLTWDSANLEDLHVRFLLPPVLYRPNKSKPETPPKDYVTYLRGLTSQGATLADEKTMTVDGHGATLMTLTTNKSLDGVLGCPKTNTAAADCFGLQPDLTLRMAVIDANGKTLLAWARALRGATHAPGFFTEFEAMLQGLKFR